MGRLTAFPLLFFSSLAFAAPDFLQRPDGGGASAYGKVDCTDVDDSTTVGCTLFTAADLAAQQSALNIEDGSTADQTGAEIDALLDALLGHANWTLDWTADLGATNLHVGNIPDLSATYEIVDATILREADVDDTPVNGATTAPASSNWAYDHVAAADPHTDYVLESDAVALTTGAGAPSSTPANEGDVYIDTTNDEAYTATGTASSADWDKTTVDTVAEITDLDADAATLSLPASTTISTFGATLTDDADAGTARTTLGLGNVENTALSTWAGTVNLDIGDLQFADLTAGDSYTNFGGATDDSVNELFAALDTAWPTGGGNVSNSGTPVDNQIAIWVTATTVEGDAGLTFDPATDDLEVAASGKFSFGAVDILSDSAGTTTLSNIDALDATTEATIEGAVELQDLQGAVTDVQVPNDITITLAASATALAANGANCSAGSYPLGVDASGAVETCTDATTEIDSAISTHAAISEAHQDEVTLAGTPDYLTIAGQVITRNAIDLTTDVTGVLPDANVADDITASSYLLLAGGTLTGELVADDLGIEYTAGDTLTDCSTFGATNGGIFYDDSEGKFKKCQDNVLSDLDTSGAEVNDLTASVTWANIPDANVPQSAVTQHQSALSVTTSQVSDLSSWAGSVNLDIGALQFADLTAGDSYTNFGAGTDDSVNELFAAIDSNWPAGGGAPTTVNYLVGTADATLTNEIVVGTSPQGQFGGTWASPTVIDFALTADADAGDFDILSVDKLEGVDAAVFIDLGADGIAQVAADTSIDLDAGSETLQITSGTDTITLGTDTGVTEINSTLQFATTGDILGAVNISSKTAATYTVGTDDANESYGTLFINGDNNAIDFTLPSAVAGMSACFMQGQGAAAAITVQPNTGDYLVVDGVRGTAATDYDSSGAGADKLCLIAIDTTDWIVTSKSGDWTE